MRSHCSLRTPTCPIWKMGLLIPVLLRTRTKGPGVGWVSEPSQPCLLGTASSSPGGLMARLPDLFPQSLCVLPPTMGGIGAGPENTLARWPYPNFPSQGPDFRVLSKQRSGVVGCPQTRSYKLEQEVKVSDVSRALQSPLGGKILSLPILGRQGN